MITIILAALLIVLLAAGALFVYGGFKRSVRRGIRNIAVLFLTTVIAVVAARLVARDYETLPLSSSLIAAAREFLTDFGMYSPLMEAVLNSTVERITYTALIAVFFIILYTIAAVTLTIIDHVNKNYRITAFRHRSFIMSVACALSGGYLIIFTMFVPPVNIIDEGKNIATTFQAVNAITSGDLNTAVENIGIITDTILNTDFIAADKEQRFSLVQSAIAEGAKRQSDPMVSALLSGLTFDSPEEMQEELDKTSELAAMATEAGINFSDLGSAAFKVTAFAMLSDADAFAAKLYSMKNYENIVRMILTTGVREFIGDDSFEYPDDVYIGLDTQDDFAIAIKLVPALIVTSRDENSENRSEENTAQIKSQMETLMNLSFVTPDIYSLFAEHLGI
jgi:hypothetical protein